MYRITVKYLIEQQPDTASPVALESYVARDHRAMLEKVTTLLADATPDSVQSINVERMQEKHDVRG